MQSPAPDLERILFMRGVFVILFENNYNLTQFHVRAKHQVRFAQKGVFKIPPLSSVKQNLQILT